MVAELPEPPLERRLARHDAGDQVRQLAHGAPRAGAGHLDVALAAHDERAAEKLAAKSLVDGEGFAREDRLVGHDAKTFRQTPVGRDAVAGFDAGDIARNELIGANVHQPRRRA